MAVATHAMAQGGTMLSGTVQISGAVSDVVTFTCFGRPVCSGTYSETIHDIGCSNSFTWGGSLVVSGVDFSAPGPIAGTIDITNGTTVVSNPNGTCTYTVEPGTDRFNYTGNWDGTRGTITFFGSGFTATGILTLQVSRTPPVFPMTVTGSVTPTVTSVQATFQPRPQDVGTQNGVYVFALAPPAIVQGASVAKDTPVQCVLAQLNSSGQLQAVSASNLQAYVTGVLTSQGQSVTMINGVATANISGATFFLGYGPTATAMINGGVNQSAVKIPGASACDPQPPQTGWWWNTAEGGRGYSIEASGNHLFFAAYLYDVSGRATWTIAAGNTSLDGSLFVGRLESYAGGQSLFGSYKPPGPVNYIGDITLAFNDSGHGTMVWPGGTVAIERFNIIPNGLTTTPLAGQPESGWWWNPQESGRGYFLEWQGNTLFMAGYMYDEAGNPLWYLSSNASPSIRGYSNTWWQYANGQTMTGAYRPPQQVSTTVAPVTIQFSGAETGIMTLPGGRSIPISRYRF